ncbi:hypothetical protein ACZ90_11555 [Streptomyces albus subsp. albus]|nr:hypothetical protein ACZ90_11555 [Streptomyces albus subsp. albus]
MSGESVETALYEIGTQRGSRRAFAEDPEAFLARYRLTDAERRALAARDLWYLLHTARANPMAVWGFWLAGGGDPAAYAERVREPAGPGTGPDADVDREGD